MASATMFRPDWVSPPGETVEDRLEEMGWTKREFASRMGVTAKHVNELLHGRASITAATASRLAAVLGSTPEFWLTREARYRAALERQARLAELETDAAWLREIPVNWMQKQGWVQKRSHKGQQVEECLSFFGVASVDAYRQIASGQRTAFRGGVNAEEGALLAWLRMAEVRASQVECEPYDAELFRAALPRARRLTNETNPEVFVPALTEICAAAGVAVVFVRGTPGSKLNGATRWLSPQKAMLGLTLRHKSNDVLWFSFFHEACHILRHGKKLTFIEGLDGLDPELEAEADRFAADTLIPRRWLSSIRNLRSKSAVESAAIRMGVAPGIVVGRMQKEGWLPWSNLNGLKVRYEWTASAEEQSD